MRGYTDEQYQWLAENAWRYTRDELAGAFNARYGTHKSGEAIRSLGKRAKWSYKRPPHWAKGLSKEEFKSHFTEDSMSLRTEHFKKYTTALNVGDLFIRNGEWYIVTADTDHVHITERSQQYDRYLYEQAHGIKLRHQDMIVHVDGDEMNNDIDNLELLPKEMLVTYSRWMASPEGRANPVINKCLLQACRLEWELRKEK